MTSPGSAPADTRMMGIVHDALRRDLTRACDTLRSERPAAQREALGRHVEWMMGFLHQHHQGEDAGLWPLVRSRDPMVGEIIDAMEADHRHVAPLLEECTAAARRYAGSGADASRVGLLDALDRLGDVLLPHLRREEDEVMPLVSVLVTAAEWTAIDRRYFLDEKSTAQLGFEGHWLLDGLDADRAEVVLHQVSPVVRPVLVHGFRRRYHRHATACWGEAGGTGYGPAPRLPARIPLTGRAEAVVDAAPTAVWAAVSDVTRVPEWSRECRRVEWLGGADRATPGARFRGTNRAGRIGWRRINEVVAADAPHRFVWRTVPTLLYPDSSEWCIVLEPVAGGGTRILQTYEVLRAPRVLALLYPFLVRSHRDRGSELADDLRRLGRVAMSARSDTVPAAGS